MQSELVKNTIPNILVMGLITNVLIALHNAHSQIVSNSQALLLSGRRAGLFTYIYTKGGEPISVDVCLT